MKERERWMERENGREHHQLLSIKRGSDRKNTREKETFPNDHAVGRGDQHAVHKDAQPFDLVERKGTTDRWEGEDTTAERKKMRERCAHPTERVLHALVVVPDAQPVDGVLLGQGDVQAGRVLVSWIRGGAT